MEEFFTLDDVTIGDVLLYEYAHFFSEIVMAMINL